MFDLKLLKRIDWFTILLVVGLVTFGLISIASIMASPFSGEESSIGDYTAKLNMVYVNKQAVNFMVGAAAFLIIIVFDYQQHSANEAHAFHNACKNEVRMPFRHES